MEFGVVYSCLEDKMYTARRGKGAFCNGEPLQVSQQQGPPSALPPRRVNDLNWVFFRGSVCFSVYRRHQAVHHRH